MAKHMLSTSDNPFNPSTEFDSWWIYDHRLGHNCCEKVDFLALTSDQLTDEENQAEIEKAIDSVIINDPTGLFIRVEIDE